MEHAELVDPSGHRWQVEIPRTRRERTRGLRGRSSLPHSHAMLLQRCRSVHTIGMRFPIVLMLLDDSLRVVGVRMMRPGRLLFPRPRVRHVLECPTETDLRPGDRLRPSPSYTLPAAP